MEAPRWLVPSPDMSGPDLDVVVLGGGGHVGLPLSLALAESGLRVGIFDTSTATLERIGRGEMPFREAGADELLRAVLPTGRLQLSADTSMVGRAETLVIVVGTPVDEFLGPSMTLFQRTVELVDDHEERARRQGVQVEILRSRDGSQTLIRVRSDQRPVAGSSPP